MEWRTGSVPQMGDRLAPAEWEPVKLEGSQVSGLCQEGAAPWFASSRSFWFILLAFARGLASLFSLLSPLSFSLPPFPNL